MKITSGSEIRTIFWVWDKKHFDEMSEWCKSVLENKVILGGNPFFAILEEQFNFKNSYNKPRVLFSMQALEDEERAYFEKSIIPLIFRQ